MRRFSRNMFAYEPEEFSTDESYNIAYRKVKRIKGFYKHLKVYIIVNIIIILSSLNRGGISNFKNDVVTNWFHTSGLLEWHTYSTALWWGLALAIHAMNVFGPDLFFGDNWEKKKIQEYMEKEKKSANKWE
ncbi:2TM domain-containing protein [Flavobacterium sp.]|uniref:2TM domain-containing protein n=1 Tax=Flavobacterium sp. TaxID=239 RepID=UPI002BAFEF7D|nr:2TM domain-containing protein [Flavobacterium sp.]HSD08345.1 2TM domain-containing protein [Flavobacterium sp.]